MSAPEKGRRLAERVKEIVSEAIPRLKDPRIGFMTVTDVRLSRDNELATIYYTVLPDTEEERARTAAGLASAAGIMRRDLGAALRVRKVPELVFERDEVAESGRRIEAVLADLQEQSDRRPDSGDDR